MAQTKRKREMKVKKEVLPPQQVIALACGIHERPFDRTDHGFAGRRYQRTEHVHMFVELICKDCQEAVDQLKELRRVMEMLRVPALTDGGDDEDDGE